MERILEMTASVIASEKNNSNSLVHQYQLPIFFVLVLGLTWPFMIWDALASHGILPFRLPVPVALLQAYMPTVAAVIVTGLTFGRPGIRALFKKLLIARVGLRWYAFAILGIAGICIAAILLANRFGPMPAVSIVSDMFPASSLLMWSLSVTVFFVIVGVLNGEELAWRGFALPRLQTKYSALTASVILSVPFTLFHLPLFFDPQMGMGSFPSFAIRAVALMILFTWLFNHTRGSVLLAYILHASFNTWTRVLSIDTAGNPFQDWMMTLVMVLLATILVAGTGWRNLSRTKTRIQE
jgi:membrane protease YdiL (CAAX protease family)